MPPNTWIGGGRPRGKGPAASRTLLQRWGDTAGSQTLASGGERARLYKERKCRFCDELPPGCRAAVYGLGATISGAGSEISDALRVSRREGRGAHGLWRVDPHCVDFLLDLLCIGADVFHLPVPATGKQRSGLP